MCTHTLSPLISQWISDLSLLIHFLIYTTHSSGHVCIDSRASVLFGHTIPPHSPSDVFALKAIGVTMVMSRNQVSICLTYIFDIDFPMRDNFSAFPFDSALPDFATCVIHHAAMAYASRWWRRRLSYFFFCFFLLVSQEIACNQICRGWLENKRSLSTESFNCTSIVSYILFFMLGRRTCPAQYEIVHAFLTFPTRCY